MADLAVTLTYAPGEPAAPGPVRLVLRVRGQGETGAGVTATATCAPGATGRITLSVPLRDAGLRQVEVDLFAEPIATAAFRAVENGVPTALCVGRARWIRAATPGPLALQALVCRSVVSQVQAWMVANSAAGDIQTMRRFNIAARECNDQVDRQFAEARRLMRTRNPANWLRAGFMMQAAGDMAQACGTQSLIADFTMGRAGHPDGADAFDRALDVFLLGGGHYDLKPRIDAIWGARNRLGDSDDVARHDFWSNLHYGYVGGAGGFTDVELNNLADVEGDDDPADAIVVRAGWSLWHRLGVRVTEADLVDLCLRQLRAQSLW